MDRNYFNFTFTLNSQLLLLCTHRGIMRCHTHNALLTVYSPWHSAVSHPQCFAYCVLTVALCSTTPRMFCMPVKKIASGQASVGTRLPNPVVCWFSMLNRKHDVKLNRSVTQGTQSLEFCVKCERCEKLWVGEQGRMEMSLQNYVKAQESVYPLKPIG